MAVVLLAAGILKGIDADEFARWLEGWTVLPPWSRGVAAVFIPVAEVGLGTMWLVRMSQRSTLYVMFLFLTAMTGVAFVQSALAPLPSCKCFGALGDHFRLLSESSGLVWRAGTLACMAGAGWLLIRGFGTKSTSNQTTSNPPNSLGAPKPGPARGFTILEVLVVVVIVGTLLAFLLPTLASTRAAARSSLSLSNLRQHAIAFTGYATDARGAFPYFSDAASGETVFTRGGETARYPYFLAYENWHFVLADGLYGLSPSAEIFFPPTFRKEPSEGVPWQTPYYWPCKFIAEPGYWNPATRREGRSQLRGNQIASLAFPDSNIMFISWWPLETRFVNVQSRGRSLATETCFGDGSASLVLLSDIGDGYPSGDGNAVPVVLHSNEWPPGLHTIGGISGRDIRR